MDAALVAPGGLAWDSRADLAVRRIGVPSRGDLGLACVSVYVAAYIRAHSRADGSGTNGNGFREGEADYWRTKLM